MIIPKDFEEELLKWVEKEVEKGIKSMPISVYIDGKQVDIDETIIADGEVDLHILSPLYVSDTGELLEINTRK